MEGRAITVVYGVASTERLHTFQRVCELSEQLEDDSTLLRGLCDLGFAYANRGEVLRAQEVANRCLALAEREQNREMLPRVRILVARCAYGAGELIPASSLLSKAMDFSSTHPGILVEFAPINIWPFVPALHAMVQQALGRPDEALRLSEEALRRARQLKLPVTLAWMLRFAARLGAERREPEATRELTDAVIALSEEHGFREPIAEARSYRAWAMAELGQTAQAIAELEASAAAATTISLFQTEMVRRVLMRVGHTDRALAVVDEDLAPDLKSQGLDSMRRSFIGSRAKRSSCAILRRPLRRRLATAKQSKSRDASPRNGGNCARP
jgi:tetratricopeptide (TPR) repeat protein